MCILCIHHAIFIISCNHIWTASLQKNIYITIYMHHTVVGISCDVQQMFYVAYYSLHFVELSDYKYILFLEVY